MKMIKEESEDILKGEMYKYQCLLLEGTVYGKKGQGRPRNTRLSNVRDWMGIRGYFMVMSGD